MIGYRDAVEIINREREDAICVTTMTQTGYWYGASERPELDIGISNGMSKASSLGLGIAVGSSDRRVIVLDGDGSLLMNLGSLATVAGQEPANFYHFVFDNGIYAVTEWSTTSESQSRLRPAMGLAAGYTQAHTFSDAEDLASELPGILSSPGPALIHVLVVPEPAEEGVDQTWESNAKMPAQLRATRSALAQD